MKKIIEFMFSKSIVLWAIVVLVCLPIINAEVQTLGTFQQDSEVSLTQNCLDSTYSNISRIMLPNGTFALNTQTAMTKNGDDYNYTFDITDLFGQYLVYGVCDEEGTETTWVYDFYITYTGNTLDTPKAILYLGLLFFLVFLFILIVIATPQLPSKDIIKDGELMDINWLKHIRPILWGTAWALLLGIVFIASNISIAYLPTNLFGEFLFMIFKFLFIMTLPMFVIWLIYIFVRIFKDKETKRMLERGIGYDMPY